MTLKFMGKKSGMTQIFDEKGNKVACTIVEVEPNVITQVKKKSSDGYDAVQIGYEKVKAKDYRRLEKRTPKPQRGHFAKNEVEPRKHLMEVRVDNAEEYKTGQEFGVEIFDDIKFVDVVGTSKGKGFQGLMKKNNFRGGPAAHGSGFHRHAGSTGMRSTPGRCFKGGPRPSQMGNKRVTVQSIEVIKVDAEKGIIILKGAVPGHTGAVLTLSAAVKKNQTASKK